MRHATKGWAWMPSRPRRRPAQLTALATVCAGLLALAVTGCSGSDEAPRPIVYQSPEGLAMVNGDGSDSRTALTPTGGVDDRHADWSPDGTRLAFVHDEADGTRDIWVSDADGANARKLVECSAPCAASDSPAWSPDGTTIAYVRMDIVDGVAQGAELRLIDPATEGGRTVASTTKTPKIGLDEPRWSPDGQRLVVSVPRFSSAAESGRFMGSALGIVEVDDDTSPSATPRLITPFTAVASYPDWHPTDDLIVFQGGSRDPFLLNGKPSNLFTVHSDGSGLTPVTTRGSEQPWIATPAWAPDGKRILVTLIHGLGDVTLATLDREGGDLQEIVDPATEKAVSGAHARQSREKAQ